jgi:hypothetical protein
MLECLGSKLIRTAYRSPWQNGVAERWVGSCRRELLDHVIVLNEATCGGWLVNTFAIIMRIARTKAVGRYAGGEAGGGKGSELLQRLGAKAFLIYPRGTVFACSSHGSRTVGGLRNSTPWCGLGRARFHFGSKTISKAGLPPLSLTESKLKDSSSGPKWY